MRSTFKVLFYLKRDTKKQQKVVLVMGRITINGTIAHEDDAGVCQDHQSEERRCG